MNIGPELTREDVQRIITEARAAGNRIDLSNLDLSRLDLRGMDLRGVNLRGMNRHPLTKEDHR